LRGIKGDTYEGGHRVPFILRWPNMITSSIKTDATICLTDIFETIIEATGNVKQIGIGEDSYSFYPIILGEKEEINRPPVIHHSGGKGMYAIRKDNWKMIFGNGSGARTKPVGVPFKKPYQLYDLETDLSESNNLNSNRTEVGEELETAFLKIKEGN